MPRDKFKRAISVALSLSMLISAPQIGSANLVPINGILAPSSCAPPPGGRGGGGGGGGGGLCWGCFVG